MSENKHETKEMEEQLTLAAELSRLIISKANVGELCRDVAFMLRELMPIDWAAIGIIENPSGMLRLSPLSPKVNSSWELGDTIQLEGTPVHWVAQNKRALVETDLQNESRFWTGTYYLKQGLRSIVCMPLFSQGEVFGSLIIGCKKPNAYGERELKLLKYTATQLALPIENYRLRQGNRHQEKQLTALNELCSIIASGRQIGEVFPPFAQRLRKEVDFQRLSIAIVNGKILRLLDVFSEVETEPKAGALYPLRDSAITWVVEHKRVHIANDFAQERLFPVDELHLRDGLRSEMRVPLFSQGRIFATMHLTSSKPNAYGEQEQDFIEQLAARIAPAIEGFTVNALESKSSSYALLQFN
jgi:GAF domain-containing protein